MTSRRYTSALFLWLLLALPALAQSTLIGNTVTGGTSGSPPVASTGGEASFFFDYNTGLVFGPKASGQWPPIPVGAASQGRIVPPIPGADMSAIINSALPGTISFTCGTYNITAATIALPSNSGLVGAGPCTILTGARQLVTNLNASNSNLTLSNLTLQFKPLSGNTKLVQFNTVSNALVTGVHFIGDGTNFSQDAIAFVSSDHYTEIGNFATAIGNNACYDQWAGSHDFVIANNQCDNSFYGILINGLNTDNTTNTTYNGVVIGNKLTNITQTAIWAGGLFNPGTGQTGVVQNINITGNNINTVNNFYGIQISDGLSNNASNNTISNTVGDAIRVGGQQASGTTSNTTVVNNNITNANSAAGVFSGITVNNNADHTSEIGNAIHGTTQVNAITITAGVTFNTLIGGPMDVGTTGVVADASTAPHQISLTNSNKQFNLTSPGPMAIGVNGIADVLHIDTGGNFYPSASTHTLGNTNFFWQQFYHEALVARGATPTNSGTCAINTQSGGNTAGIFSLNGACTAGTVILTFAVTAPNGYACPPATDQTNKSTFLQSAHTATTATLTGTGATSDVVSFGPCVAY